MRVVPRVITEEQTVQHPMGEGIEEVQMVSALV